MIRLINSLRGAAWVFFVPLVFSFLCGEVQRERIIINGTVNGPLASVLEARDHRL